jgi:polysaccharide export outer membrane protein
VSNDLNLRTFATFEIMSRIRFLRLLLLGSFLVAALSSCVTNRKYQMLQNGDANKSNLPADSVMRKYLINEFEYTIQPNDILSIRFESLTAKEYDFLARPVDPNAANAFVGGALLLGDLVDENGEVPYPVVGKVKVTGLTVFQAQEKLQELANQYFESAVVKVRLLNYRITMLGEFNREGSITLNNNRVTMLEAIGLAGGLRDLADKSNVKLVRQIDNNVEVVYLNLLDENFVHSPYYYVYQNDILIAPPLRQRPYRTYFGQNLSLILSSVSLLLLVLNFNR